MSASSTAVSPIVISGIGPLCPQVSTIEELTQANFSGVCEAENSDLGSWFDPKRFLGQRGFKYLTSATRYVLAAARIALEDAGIQDSFYLPEAKGVVVGTNFGVFSTLEEMDRLVLAEGSDALSPMAAPNFSVNLASSYISIKYGFKAYNITLTNPMVAGLEAVMFGAQAIHRGRSDMALVGATEDSPPALVGDILGLPIGNGAACTFVLETLSSARSRQSKVYAQVGKSSLRFVNFAQMRKLGQQNYLTQMIRQELNNLLSPEQTSIHYYPLLAPFWFNQLVDCTVQSVLSDYKVRVSTHSHVGASGAFITVSPLLQLAAAITKYSEGLILTTSPYGHISMLNLTKPE